ncbi:MAG: 4Fe-4S dicluster domain-containing protein [Alistipes sp.]|jgi:ferredoxin|nr:4Fe-4S dicluster domain-containing protein [Alistipes sp.]
MLRKIRIAVAWVVFILATLLVLDFTGALHVWLGWIAKVQLVPAVLAVNVVALIVVVLLTVVFGRVYCSTLCPLGIMQDGVSNLSGRRKGKKARFRHSRPVTWLRYGLLVVFVAALVAGISVAVSLLDPWGSFGRIAQNFLAPLWRLGNNVLAWFAERADSYAFHTVDVYVKSGIVLGAAALWLVGLAVLAWWKGRIYCNSVCPVGTFLGLLSSAPVFRVSIDESKCTKCGLCEKKCKSECLDSKAGTVDRSRCVVCFDCLKACNFGAIRYKAGKTVVVGVGTTNEKQEAELGEGLSDQEKRIEGKVNKKGMNRRNFFTVAALAAAASPAAVKAQQVERILLKVDGGLAELEDKIRPERAIPVTPPGSEGARNMKQHCVACQLCVAACPNNVLVPSSKLAILMQPEMTFERGYCRPECVECAEVCPAGAIKKITPADKTAISVGNAVYNRELCVVPRDNVACTECERHCPTKTISMVPLNAEEAAREARGRPRTPILKTPVVDPTKCIGCGACENLCPARPLSAIHVEGNVAHHAV